MSKEQVLQKDLEMENGTIKLEMSQNSYLH